MILVVLGAYGNQALSQSSSRPGSADVGAQRAGPARCAMRPRAGVVPLYGGSEFNLDKVMGPRNCET